MIDRLIGVGFLGAGQATQAIHLPTLATMPEHFRVVRVMDTNAAVAGAVSARCGAFASANANDVYDDPKVDVVVVCSPNNFHAEHVIDCCRAGKRLVLCEKPLATDRAEAEAIKHAAGASSTIIVVGAMHVYDPAFCAAFAAWRDLEESASFVESAIYLPMNDVFIDQATDQVGTPMGPPRVSGDPSSASYHAARLRGAMLGLAIHDLPLIRQFQPSLGDVVAASYVPPFGYAVTTATGTQAARLLAVMPGQWAPQWRLRAFGRAHLLHIAFTPSYVLSGSSRAALMAAHETRTFAFSQSGYEAMWAHVAEVVREGAAPTASLETVTADILLTLDLADRIEKVVRRT